MINVKIGADEKDLASVESSWINQQINRRRAAGEMVCVRVRIQVGSLDMVLSTPTCTTGGGGGRLPNREEQEIFALWAKHKLDRQDFTGGALVAFLHQLQRLL